LNAGAAALENETDGSKSRLRWGPFLALLCGLVVALVVRQFEREAMAEAAGISVAAVTAVAIYYWDRRARQWFWPFVILAGLIHAVVVCVVPWPDHYRAGRGDALYFVGDWLVMTGIVLLVERLVRKNALEV
jgi:hypothetical protein